jgi:hypothetical protein
MSWKRKYTEKTLAEKAKALQDLDSGMSMGACVIKYSVSVSMIINWKKNKSKIVSSIFEFTSLFQKRPTRVNGNGKVIDERVYEWFANVHCRNIPVFGLILQTKALQVAANIGLNDFRASNG